MTNINNSLNKEEVKQKQMNINYLCPCEVCGTLTRTEWSLKNRSLIACSFHNPDSIHNLILNKIQKETADQIIKDSPILEEDKNDLLLTKTIKGKFKRLGK